MTQAAVHGPDVTAPTPCVPAPPSARARSILVIDDEPGVRQFAARVLSSAGFIVTAAATGSQGLHIAGRDSWDLVLLDLCLPDLNGEEVLRRLLGERPTQPILVWSATADPRAPGRCRAFGACDYLAKPCTRAELMRSIAANVP